MSTRETMSKTLILCDCLGSQTLDGAGLEQATGLACSKVHTNLCGTEAELAAKVIAAGDCVIACGQETAFFEDLAAELEVDPPAFLDLRDRAGWTDDAGDPLPKMAALTAEALVPAPTLKAVDVECEGVCLIIGAGEVAFTAAAQLCDTLAVTVLQTDADDPPVSRAFDVIRGQLRNASGALGGFDLRIDGLQQIVPGGRGGFSFAKPQDGGRSSCDVIVDLSGGTPLFPAPEKREGYLRADPGSQPAVAAAVLAASQMIGTFEKPLYVRMETILCAHSRAEQVGCSRCLDACPTGAISSAGEHVAIDPMICAGCGACAALCPSGAIRYDAPPTDYVMQRIQTMARTYRDAGGAVPRLLVVDAHGADMIRLGARFAAGLPVDVIPLEMDALNAFGHAEALVALAAGFGEVAIVPGPGTDRDVLAREVELACAIGGPAVRVLDEADPEALCAGLYGAEVSATDRPVRPMGTRRQVTRMAAKALTDAPVLALPDGAPYGAVLVNTDSCTLCLSCVSLCPSGALGDNPDLPQLRFQEDACLQCGICATICPEDAITYEARLNLCDSALEQVVLHEEEPAACIECGVLFGSKATIARITEKLENHSMFPNEAALRMVQMCDDCRVKAQFKVTDNPLQGGPKPRVRMTEDYLSKRRDH